MDGADYINKVSNWLSSARGYNRLPGNSLEPGDEPVLPGEYHYSLQGRSLVLVKLVDAGNRAEQEILAGLDGEFRSLAALRADRGLQFAYQLTVFVFPGPLKEETVKLLTKAKQVSAVSRCYLLPWVVDLAAKETFVHHGLPRSNFGLLGGDSPFSDIGNLAAEDRLYHPVSREEVRLQAGRPWVTYGLIGICVGLAVLTGFSTDDQVMIRFGAKVNSLITAGEYWRLLTSVFLHFGFLHLAFNMLFLYNLGPGMEALYGHWRYLAIYLAAGLLGSIASYALTPGMSVGASGALFGLIGAYLYFWLRRPKVGRRLGREMLILLVFNVAFGLINPSVDNWAHFGGLSGGFLASAAVGLPDDDGAWYTKLSAIAVLGGLAWWGFSHGVQ